MTCIVCPIGCDLCIKKTKKGYEVSGNKCPRGEKYAIEEMTAPKRTITSTVRISGSKLPVIPVKTSHAIPKEKIFDIMQLLEKVNVKSPVHIGDIVLKNVLDTGVDIIATKNG
jgi:CxxC motif-containing protein